MRRKKKRRRAGSAINSSGQKNGQDKDKRVQRKEETTMERAIRAAKQEIAKISRRK
jgi:hypothetical protein